MGNIEFEPHKPLIPINNGGELTHYYRGFTDAIDAKLPEPDPNFKSHYWAGWNLGRFKKLKIPLPNDVTKF